MSTTNYQPIFDALEDHAVKMNKLYAKALEKDKEENYQKALKLAHTRMYEIPEAPLAKFTAMKVSSENAKTMNAVFKVLETLPQLHANETDEIKAKGAERGFTEDESLFLYNLAVYGKALDNLRSQKDMMVEIIVSEA